MTSLELRTCPWCGVFPVAERWRGGGPRNWTMIHCENVSCPSMPSVLESNEKKAAAAWNRRWDVEETTDVQVLDGECA